ILIQPLVFFTTKGGREFSVFFDAPHLLPAAWRWGGRLGWEQQLATPYYGIGNNTVYDKTLDAKGSFNPYFYRYGRAGLRLSTDLQRPIAGPLRLFVGAGTRASEIDDTPLDSGTTLLHLELAGAPPPKLQATYL